MSPSPEHVEYAEMLLRLAESDLQACRVLAAASDVADGAVGSHAQQAVEKALKTAIVLTEAELPRTHDLERLSEQAAARAPLPVDLQSLAGVRVSPASAREVAAGPGGLEALALETDSPGEREMMTADE